MSIPINKILYVAFLVLGTYQALIPGNYLDAAASLGIALAFDPFDPEQKWGDRPIWQRVVMISHLAFVAAMFGLGMGLNDR
jgi:hypothetical protein